MRKVSFALAAFSFLSVLLLPAATRIDDPKAFVTEVYRRLVAAQSTHTPYTPPDNIYTPRLEKLLREDKRKSKGEVGCLDFVFWINAQDWTITHLAITSADEGQERKTVITKFRNGGEPQEIHFDFHLNAGRWLLDDVHSLSAPPWTLSETLEVQALSCGTQTALPVIAGTGRPGPAWRSETIPSASSNRAFRKFCKSCSQ